ncbi:MAG: MFS transporter [Chloroflexota bacterium]
MPEPPAAGAALDEPGHRSPLIALRYRDFRFFWGGQAISSAGSMMQTAAIGWQVYLLTHSALALGLIGLFRVVPIVVFSIWGGVVADVINRRLLMLFTQTSLIVISAALAVITISGVAQLWMIYVLTAAGAAALAFDSPARQALVPSLVPRVHLSNALSLSSTVREVAGIVGPSLAGIIIATEGVATVYVVDAVSYLSVVVALLLIHPPAIKGAAATISISAAVEGLRFVARSPILLSTMLLDFVATFFSSAIALLPIFATDILHAGARGYGILYAAPSAGAILAGIAMTFVAPSIRRQGTVILFAVGAYATFTVLFGLSHIFVLSVVMLAGTGASDTVSTILRQTVRQIITPDALRGRMTSVSMVFFMGCPQLGELEAGVVARSFGAPVSVVSGGLAALLATILIAVYGVNLRRYQREHP